MGSDPPGEPADRDESEVAAESGATEVSQHVSAERDAYTAVRDQYIINIVPQSEPSSGESPGRVIGEPGDGVTGLGFAGRIAALAGFRGSRPDRVLGGAAGFWTRRALVLTAAVGAVALAAVLALPLVRTHSGTSGGTPSGSASKGTREIEQLGLTAAISDKKYRAIFPLFNAQAKEQRLDEVVLLVTFRGPPCAETPLVLVYEIQTPVAVGPSGRIDQGAVAVDSGLAQGFTTPASGEFNLGCGINQLQMRFRPPGAILARRSTTSILVDVPRDLRVTKMINGVAGFEISRAGLPSIGRPTGVEYIAFHAIAVTSAGSRLGSCFLLAKSDYRPGSGPQDCDAKIEGNPVFWMQKFGPNRKWKGYERAS
ncbi:hypothetical protein [Actinomadura chibensis]|uniref:Uncharacterized protein n=1 Tax=Actinomadura chibensis TaxID=392828 RepID=A0A5D0NT71_9ACTN|nr:hypothetical protein [Actinomadura chibensis]TYB47890.1 hypothetical protein FXF69_01185 [Actinomadura chibensis]